MYLLRITLFCQLLFCAQIALQAQCYGNPQTGGGACAGSPLVLYASNGSCSNCTFTWGGNPSTGQGTHIATYTNTSLPPGSGMALGTVYMNGYNPNASCGFLDIFSTCIASEPGVAAPTLINGPWDGDTSKVWIYARTYANPDVVYGGPGTIQFYPSWTVTGGTLARQVHIGGFNTFYKDSVFVKWNAGASMMLQEHQATIDNPPLPAPDVTCNWTPPTLVNPNPPLNIFNGPFCNGATVGFYTFNYPGSTFTWSINNGTVISGQGTHLAQIQVNGPATVTLVRDSSGTLTNTSMNVSPNNLIMSLGPDRAICQYSSTTLSATAGYTSYAWSTGAQTQNITVSAPGTYSVTGTVGGNCPKSDTIVITTTPVVRPNLGADIHACAFPVTLNAGPGYTTYAWSNGATTQTISPTLGGTYRVTATDGNGCASSDTIIVFNNVATVSMPATLNYCVPGSQTLSATTSNVTSYLWSTGATTSTITVSALGTLSIWLQGSNAFCSTRDTIVVTGNPRPTPNIGPDQTVCPGSSVTFDAGPGYSNYAWSNGATTQQISPTTPGSYHVTVTSSAGCTGSDTVQLLNYPFIAPNLGPDIHVCQATATLDAGPGYASYNWSTGASTQTISVVTGGNYSVTVTAANGCSGSDAILVTFSSFSFSLGNDTTLCQPHTFTADPHLVGPFTYLWSSGATSPTVTLSAPGVANLSLTAANAFGCVAHDTVLVTILPAAPAIHLGADTVLCADTTMVLDAGAGFVSYLWSTNASTAAVTVNAGGVYYVVGTDANGCTATDTISITGLVDCVFPGDVNYDHVADLLDVLTLGNVIGGNGPNRNQASLLWYGQECSDWSGSVLPGVNEKQADTDGNGLVDANDTLAIDNNFGNTHARIGDISTGNASLRIVPLNGPVAAGAIARFGVYYDGGNGAVLDSVQGLAVEMNWSMVGLSGPGLVAVDYANAWFAPTGNRLDFTHLGVNSAGLALTRTSGTDTSGAGLAMELLFQTDPSIPIGQVVNFAPQVTLALGVGHTLEPVIVSSTATAITIQGLVAVTPQVEPQVTVWPVPADRAILVQVDGSVVQRVQLMNMMGQVVLDLPGNGQQSFSLPVDQLPAGNYCIQVRTEDGLAVRKVVVGH